MPSALNMFAHRSRIIAILLFTTTLLTLEHPGSHSLIQPISEHLGKHTTIYWRTLAPRTGDTRALTTGGQYTGINFLTCSNLCNGSSSLGLSTDTMVFTVNDFVTLTHHTLDDVTDFPEYPLNDRRHSWYTNPDERNFYFQSTKHSRMEKRNMRRSRFKLTRQTQNWNRHFISITTLLLLPTKLVSQFFNFFHSHFSTSIKFSPKEDTPNFAETNKPMQPESPSMIQIFLRFHGTTKPMTIRNKSNLADLQHSINTYFPYLEDYYLSLNGKILLNSTILTFNDFAYRTIDINLRLRGGMKAIEEEEDDPITKLFTKMFTNLSQQLTQEMNTKFEEQQRKLEKRLEIIVTKKEIDDELDEEDSFHTPIRTKLPTFNIEEVERTPYFKRSKSMVEPKEVKSGSPLSEKHDTTTTSTTITSAATHSFKKGYKPITNADLKVYKVGESWEAWNRRFLFVANSCSWNEGERVATLCHFMPENIKTFLENLEPTAFANCETLSHHLESLFDLYEKTDEEREKEFTNITCRANESVATFYIRFRNLATLAKETRNDKLKKYFINAIRPLTLHQKLKEKEQKIVTLSDAYQRALVIEKEQARIRKLRREEEDRRNVRSLTLDQPKNRNNNNRNNNNNIIHNTRNKAITSTNKSNNTKDNKNNDKNDNIPLIDRSTTWLMEHQYCAFCTQPTNSSAKPHKHTECMEQYPFYNASEIRQLIKIKQQIPKRTQWPESNKRKQNTLAPKDLKGSVGSNQ